MAKGRNRLGGFLRLLGFGVIVYVLWMGLSFYHRVNANREAVISASNLRDLGQALFMYAGDHGGNFPVHFSDAITSSADLPAEFFVTPWGSETPPQGKTAEELAAQVAAGGHCSYGYLGAGRTTADVGRNDVLLYEADGDNPSGGMSCLLGDGHVEKLPAAIAIQMIIATVMHANHPSTFPTTVP